MSLDSNAWNQRYISNNTGWDIGYVSTPIKEYIDQITNKNIKILIPGCGNAHEAEYLFKNGFKNYEKQFLLVPTSRLGLVVRGLVLLLFFVCRLWVPEASILGLV